MSALHCFLISAVLYCIAGLLGSVVYVVTGDRSCKVKTLKVGIGFLVGIVAVAVFLSIVYATGNLRI